MTPTLRAEKIVERFSRMTFSGEFSSAWLVDQIVEAQRESFSAARQKAAGIVRDQYHEAENITGGEWLAAQIEQMEG